MKTASILGPTTLGAAALVLLATLADAGSRPPTPRTLLGEEVAVGHGTARMFVELTDAGAPSVVGVALTEDALTGLATRMNTTSRCWDKDGDGRVMHGECLGDYEATLKMPSGTEGLGLPFRWSTVNWNPEGHVDPAPHAWSAPHFDFHFFTAEQAVVRAIRPGPCAEFIDCADFERASKPLPAAHLPEGYVDVGAAVGMMGNHLIDSSDPEIADPTLGFSKTFIYGVYDGRIIFLEPMVAHAYIASRPNACAPIKTPAAYAVAAYYPTLYCVAHDETTATHRVTLEGFVRR